MSAGKKLIVWLVVVALVLSLAGCGGKKAAPVKDTLVVAQGTDVDNLDPHGVTSTPAAIVTEHIFETLVTLDENFQVIPRLATSWEPSSDGMYWTFKLRQGVKFHDGTPFNAEAVKFNIERLLNPDTKVPLRSYISMVQSAEVIDEHTVKIVLKYPHAPFLHRMSSASNAIISPKAVQTYGQDLALHPVGTGPYKFVEWVKGDKLVLERNEEYWGTMPKIKTIVFKPVPENSTRVTLLESGDVDLIVRVPPHEVERLKAKSDLDVIVSPSTREIYVALNNNWGPLKDPKVRQALNYAVNKEEIVSQILMGAGKVVQSPILEEMFGYKKVGAYPYDPAKAKALLAEAGYPNGFEVVFHTPDGRYLMDKKIAEAIQHYLSAVGVKAELKTMEWAAYLAFVRKPINENTAQMFLMGWGPWILDGDQMVYPLFLSEQWPPAGSNYGFYKNEKVDEQLKIGTASVDPQVRLEAYGKAQEMIMQDAPWIFLHGEQQIIAKKKSLKGVIILPIEQVRLYNAYFE